MEFNGPCVYMLVNKVNKKRYIGQTVDSRTRFNQHKTSGKNQCGLIGEAFRKYGHESFEFKILEKCPPSKLREKEFKYIALLKPEYNLAHKGADPKDEYRLSKSANIRISRSLHKKLQEAAEIDYRRLGVFVERLLIKALENYLVSRNIKEK